MKVLISHSWKDKTLADRLAHDLEGVVEVWIDTQQLVPGEPIQENIDKALAGMDWMLLLWSDHARASRNVGDEIASALRLGIRVIPCLLDGTPVPASLADRLGVDFSDYAAGFTRLNVVFMRQLAGALGIEDDEALRRIKDYDGLLDYVQNYRIKRDIEGDGAHWINRMLTRLDGVNSHGTELMDRMQRAADFTRRVMKAAEDRASDRAALQALHAEAQRNEDLEPAARRTVLRLLETCIAEAPAQDMGTDFEAREPTASRGSRGDTWASGNGSDPHGGHHAGFAGFGGGAPGAAADPVVDRGEVGARLRGFVPRAVLDEAVDAVCYYIDAARPVLDTLESFARRMQSAAGAMVVASLRDYLEDPDDLLPEGRLGAWGRIDDAWLIHNTAYRLVEAGLLPAVGFAVDWNRIIVGDRVVLHAMPPSLHLQLQQRLVHGMNLIAQEADAYRPQFERGGHGYAAHMPYGRDVEAAADSLFTEAQLGAWNAEGWE